MTYESLVESFRWEIPGRFNLGAACADQRGEILHYRISERVSQKATIVLDLDREVWRAMSEAKAVKRPTGDLVAAR